MSVWPGSDLFSKNRERDKRPTEDEINALIEFFRSGDRTIFPIGRIIRFAIATAIWTAQGWPYFPALGFLDIGGKGLQLLQREPGKQGGILEITAVPIDLHQLGADRPQTHTLANDLWHDAKAYNEMLGYYSQKAVSRGVSHPRGGGQSGSSSENRRALMLPQELKEMTPD